MTDEYITHARAGCTTCAANWYGINAFEDAERHAEQLQHHVKGLSQTRLDIDKRPEHE